MFTRRAKIRLYHTDATEVIFFGHLFQLAMDTLEDFLAYRDFPWQALMASPYFFPVVHTEADYLHPLRAGDEVEITLKVVKLGTSSVTFHYTMQHVEKQCLAGRVESVHVLVDKKTRTSLPLPDFLRTIFTAEKVEES